MNRFRIDDNDQKDRLNTHGKGGKASVAALAFSWMLTAAVLQIINPASFLSKEYYAVVTPAVMAALVLVMWLFFRSVDCPTVLSVMLVLTALVYFASTIIQKNDIFYTFGCCAVTGILIGFCSFGLSKHTLPRHLLWAAAFLMIAAFTAWIGGICAAVYYNYGTPTYDFGIFAQMFYYMKKTGIPYTTCERNGLLSHFAVHLSPVFYLLLPVYWLFPSPATLEISQCLVLASGIIPLLLLCRRHRLTNGMSLMMAGIYFTYPAFVSACFFHIHENNFLAPFVLWMLLAFEVGDWLGMLLTTVLLLSVKEDAAVYAAVVILYFLAKDLGKQEGKTDDMDTAAKGPGGAENEGTAGENGSAAGENEKTGTAGGFKKGKEKLLSVLKMLFRDPKIPLLLMVVGYFALAVGYLSGSGDGAMTGRYGNYIYDQSGSLITVLKAVFQNPMYVLSECFTDEKLFSTFVILLPTGFLAVCFGSFAELLLMIPYVLLNLMSGYYYQHIIGYQYYFGSGAFLFYLTVIHIEGIRKRKKNADGIGADPAAAMVPEGIRGSDGTDGKQRGGDAAGAREASGDSLVRKALVFGLLCSCFLTISINHGRLFDYLPSYWKNDQVRSKITQVLSVIPEDAQVVSSTFLLPELSGRPEIYDIDYTDRECEYVALDLRYSSGREAFEAYEQDERYELAAMEDNAAAVFRLTE